MRLRDRRSFAKPEVMIIPMIDIMFFLLVFFMISTLYMVNLRRLMSTCRRHSTPRPR